MAVREELIYWQGSELFHEVATQRSAEGTAFVDRLARLLKHPEYHLDELRRLRSEHSLLQNVRGAAPQL